MRSIVYIILAISLCASGCGDILADKSSDDACRYDVAQDLDKGNYDEVINSSCADTLQVGAAYFGRAGFDILRVVDVLTEASNYDNALDLFLNELVGVVTEQDLSDLVSSKEHYQGVAVVSEHYKDAQFYLALVQAMNGLALIKKVIDSDGDGEFVDCDAGVTEIALRATGQQGCAGLMCTWPTADVHFFNTGRPGTYRILSATFILGLCAADEDKLLYLDAGSGNYRVAVTAGMCLEDGGNLIPCPMIVNGGPLGLVPAFDEAINDSISGLDNAVDFGVDSDVVDEMRKIRDDACGGNTCSDVELADYISTLVN